MDLLKVAEQRQIDSHAQHQPRLSFPIKEGEKFRLQDFRGVVIQISGATPLTRTFTVRKVSGGIGVERIFPFQSPAIDSITVNKVGKVRRARIFYLRKLAGKKARIKEKGLAVKPAAPKA